MANMFSVILLITTLITGILWLLSKCVFSSKARKLLQYIKITKKSNRTDKKALKTCEFFTGWLETVGSFFPMLAIVLIVRSCIYEPFRIPSCSMMPTLLIGDFILVKKFAYSIKDPIFKKTLIKTGKPKRGDIVVFKYPKDTRLDYIKRIVGLPGDKVTYDAIAKELTIQTECQFNDSCLNILPVVYSNVETSNFVQVFDYGKNGKKITSGFFQLPKGEMKENGIRLLERQETLGNSTHRVLIIPMVQDSLEMYYQQSTQKLATWIIPPGHYFMMGDNRDNSSDSRYWGLVSEIHLLGKVTSIWISFEKQEGEWPTGIRLNRIGRIY